MVVDNDGNTAIEKRIEDFLRKLTDSGPWRSHPVTPAQTRRPALPSFREYLATTREREMRRRAERIVAKDRLRRYNTGPDTVTMNPEL